MATKYTTKTAAFRATQIDGRQIAVSKKIEIGSGETATKITDDAVSAEDLLIGVDVKNAETGETTRERKSVTELIQQAQESAAIQVGRDADKNWSVDETAIEMVKKISFLGDYVNVVEGENGEVKLYIGQNKSLSEMASGALNGTPSNSTTIRVYTCEDEGNTFELPVAAGAETKAKEIVANSSSDKFTDVTMTAKSTSNTNYFTLDSTSFIWVRTKYNNGEYSDWGKVSLAKDRGTYTRNSDPTKNTVSSVAFSADAQYGEVALPTGITMSVGNHVLTADADAQYGKVPGRCETAFNIKMAVTTIATLEGGIIELQWGISATEPTAPKTVSFFVTERKTAALASLTLDSVSKTVATVSGINYVTQGTTAVVSTGNITDSQWKSATSEDRLKVSAAGGATKTYKINDLTLVSGDTTKSDAVYSLDNAISEENRTVTFGSTETDGHIATVTATAYGYNSGGSKSQTVANFWGDIAKDCSDTYEPWGEETYRYEDTACTTLWTPTADVTTKTVDIKGTSTIGAVAQYGQLMHPSKAVAAEGKPDTYATASGAASYIRKFVSSDALGKFKVSATGIGKGSDVKVYWVNPRPTANGALVELSDSTNGSNTVENGYIIHAVNSATEDASATNVIIFVIPNGSSTKVGKVTIEVVE